MDRGEGRALAYSGALRTQRLEERDDLEGVLPAGGVRGVDPVQPREQFGLGIDALACLTDEAADELRGCEAGIVERAPDLTQ